MSAREIAALLFRELGLVLLALAIPVLLAIGLYTITPPSYVADAKVLVTSGRESQARGEIGQTSASAPQVTAVEVLNSEVELLKSRELFRRTADAVGASRLFPNLSIAKATGKPRPEQVDVMFAGALDVRAVKDANVIDVSLKAPTPALATEALARYLEFYQQLHGEAYSRPVAGILNTQLNGYEARLRDVESQIAAFTEQNRLFDPDQERKNLLDTRSNLSASVIQLRTHAAELGSRVGSLQALKSATPLQQQDYSETEQSEAVERARGQLLDLQVQKTKLAANYQPGSRQLRDLQDQIDAVNGFLGGEGRKFSGRVRTGRNPLYDELQAETARARAQVGPEETRAAAVERAIGDIDKRLAQISEGQKTLDPLQRERRQLAATLDTFRQRQAEASLLENLDKRGIANVRVIQPAAPVSTDKPDAPKLSTFLVGGAAAGVLLAGVVLALLFALKNTFIGPESVEARTKIPVLVSLPVRGG